VVALLALLAFLVGSVPFGYLIVRLVFRQDIRKLGSGNIGMTNVWRSFGCVPGFATLVLDLGKGYLPVLGMRLLVKSEAVHPWGSIELTLSAIGLAAIFGHAFTPWLAFRGGKGVATGLGVFTAIVGAWVLVPLAAFAVVFLLFRYVSVGSMTAGAAFLAMTVAVPSLRGYIPLGAVVAALILCTHLSNIARLGRGEERRFRF